MTDQPPPKRRGRPPGSKNRAATVGLTVLKPGEPVPWDQAGYVEAIAGPEPVSVKIVFRRGLGQTGTETIIQWPPEWRLPQAGEAIHLSDKIGGFIEYINWWVEEGNRRVVIYLR